MPKAQTKAQLQEALAQAQKHEHAMYVVLDAYVRGLNPDATEGAYILAVGTTLGVNVRLGLYRALAAHGGVVHKQETSTDGTYLGWTVHYLDDDPFPLLPEYAECRYAWQRLRAQRERLTTEPTP